MFAGKKTGEKSYEQYMEEALKKIPLYSPEWTNYNLSDPGITMLENLSAFTVLQQSYINQETDEMQYALLELAGFKRKSGSCAKVLLAAEDVEESFVIPEKQQFLVGNLVFESTQAVEISGGKIIDIYTESDGWKDCSVLMKKENQFPVSVFSEKPEKDMAIYFFMNELSEQEDTLTFYIKVYDKYGRNPKAKKAKTAKIKWQCYTKKGFVDIQAEDNTEDFLFDGTLVFHLDGIVPKQWNKESEKGYVIRGVLENAEYDIPPQILQVTGFLFEVKQKQTKAVIKEFLNCETFSFYNDIMEEEYIRLYKWNEEENCYYLCSPNEYEMLHEGYGMYTFCFKEEQERVLLSAYTHEMMQKCKLGTVYGYDNETITLPERYALASNVSLIIEYKDRRKDEFRYYHVFPNVKNAGGFLFKIEEDSGKIIILDSGEFNGSELYIGEFAVSEGEAGNVLAGKQFVPAGYQTKAVFYNPAEGEGGRHQETRKQLETRYLFDVNESYTAVCAQDYERIVKEVPGLCIDKVNAYMKPNSRVVHVAVKPSGLKEFPGLSADYKKEIMEAIEERRQLNTKVHLERPVYLPVNVYGKIFVKEQYADAGGYIENIIRGQIDYVNTDRGFGEVLKFSDLFEKVEKLECVESIAEFNVRPGKLNYAEMEGVDIHPDGNCLLYPGEIKIDVHLTRF